MTTARSWNDLHPRGQPSRGPRRAHKPPPIPRSRTWTLTLVRPEVEASIVAHVDATPIPHPDRHPDQWDTLIRYRPRQGRMPNGTVDTREMSQWTIPGSITDQLIRRSILRRVVEERLATMWPQCHPHRIPLHITAMEREGNMDEARELTEAEAMFGVAQELNEALARYLIVVSSRLVERDLSDEGHPDLAYMEREYTVRVHGSTLGEATVLPPMGWTPPQLTVYQPT